MEVFVDVGNVYCCEFFFFDLVFDFVFEVYIVVVIVVLFGGVVYK